MSEFSSGTGKRKEFQGEVSMIASYTNVHFMRKNVHSTKQSSNAVENMRLNMLMLSLTEHTDNAQS